MKKRWKVSPPNRALQRHLSKELNVSPLTAQLLINRGLVESDKAFSFLLPSLNNLHDPFTMRDMDKVVDRLIMALKGKERVVVYGDFDVDGITSTSLLLLFFKEIGMDIDFYIPERLKEGYGLNVKALKRFSEEGVNLVITTDCGISNYDEIVFATSLGLDIIITDHHEIPAKLPPALAILDPKQSECRFPFKELAGVGVVFNLIMALRSRLREMNCFSDGVPNIKRYLDLVAMGTVADLMPLINENRILVKFGVDEITNNNRKGIRALRRVCGMRNGKVRTGQIGFQLAPRINAAGRLGRADIAVRLLTTEDEKEAVELAGILNRENSSRKVIEGKILLESISMIESDMVATGRILNDKGIFLYSEGWHPGVIGIVASRLVERYNRPAILIAVDDDTGRGSARGMSGFHILEGLKKCDSLLEKYGGHKAAAGFTVKRENIERLGEDLIRILSQSLTNEDLVPEVLIDILVSLDELDAKTVSEIESLAPFGPLNSEPVLGARDTHVLWTNVVGERHLKLKVKQNGEAWDAIGYGLGDRHPAKGDGFDMAFSPYIDEWRGVKSLKLRVKELYSSM
jgi:single-stranded-DNA-specific exonuclease